MSRIFKEIPFQAILSMIIPSIIVELFRREESQCMEELVLIIVI